MASAFGKLLAPLTQAGIWHARHNYLQKETNTSPPPLHAKRNSQNVDPQHNPSNLGRDVIFRVVLTEVPHLLKIY